MHVDYALLISSQNAYNSVGMSESDLILIIHYLIYTIH